MKALLVAMASDRVPPDVRVDELNQPVQLWAEARFALMRRYEGRGPLRVRTANAHSATNDDVAHAVAAISAASFSTTPFGRSTSSRWPLRSHLVTVFAMSSTSQRLSSTSARIMCGRTSAHVWGLLQRRQALLLLLQCFFLLFFLP